MRLKVERFKNKRVKVLAKKENANITLFYCTFDLVKNSYYKASNGEEELDYNYADRKYLIMDLKIIATKDDFNSQYELIRMYESEIIAECLKALKKKKN